MTTSSLVVLTINATQIKKNNLRQGNIIKESHEGFFSTLKQTYIIPIIFFLNRKENITFVLVKEKTTIYTTSIPSIPILKKLTRGRRAGARAKI